MTSIFSYQTLLLILHFSINSRYSCTGPAMIRSCWGGGVTRSVVAMLPFSLRFNRSLYYVHRERPRTSLAWCFFHIIVTIFLCLSGSLSLSVSLPLACCIPGHEVPSPTPQRDDDETPRGYNDIFERLSDGCPPDLIPTTTLPPERDEHPGEERRHRAQTRV